MNMNSDYSCIRWILNDANIKGFKSLCVDNESLEKRLKQAINLIPTTDPFITSYVYVC
jgi:hypothetical protein